MLRKKFFLINLSLFPCLMVHASNNQVTANDEKVLQEAEKNITESGLNKQKVKTIQKQQLNKSIKKDSSGEWKNKVLLGFNSASGNSFKQSISSNLQFQYTQKRVQTNFGWAYGYGKDEDGNVNERNSSYNVSLKYLISQKWFLNNEASYVSDSFDSYYRTAQILIGPGYRAIDDGEFYLDFIVGPGWRYQKPNLNEDGLDSGVRRENTNEPVAFQQLNFKWQILKKTSINFKLLAVEGSSNNAYTANIGLTNAITDNLALSISNNYTYNTNILPTYSHYDNKVNVQIQYLF